MFDVQAKRIHEYKRQHLKTLHILHLYLELKAGRLRDMPPQTFIFAGKAAPSYYMAKLMIRLVHAVGEMVNHDPEINDLLKVVFMPDFNVKNAQRLYPAADLSEQISMAGKEASGTGNMKFALNGALTIGTLDGANVEIREAVGEEHFFLFGLNAAEVVDKKMSYNPDKLYQENDHLGRLLDTLVSGKLSGGDSELFRPIYDNLRWQDPYLLLADFDAYHQCYMQVLEVWKDPENWSRHSIFNSARMGRFSADRSIVDYCKKIWQIKTLHEPLQPA
jgi:starch phosphorylase